MDKSDVVLLLAFAGTFDYRKVGDADVEAWHLAVDDLDFEDAKQAVVTHYRNTRERLMPVDVRQGVKAIRAERRGKEPHEVRALPSRFEGDVNRQVRMERGAATVRQVLAPLLEHLAEQSGHPEVPALERLRAITAGPDWVSDEEVSQ